MLADPPDLKTYVDLLKSRGFSNSTIVTKADGTLFHPLSLEDKMIADLPVIVSREDAEIHLGELLARGGMAEVFLAQQRSVDREVAVKRAVVAQEEGGSAAADLLVEGRVTGALEHPNIVPVYALGKNPDGDVLLVMKRIEGTSWQSMLAARRSPHDDVARHVEILIDVCRAVSFAHSKQVVHRDLKPANIMVGLHDEVYVLDWGLAVGIGDGAPAGVPHATDATGLIGSPRYMAPEMAIPDGQLDQRTDTFLLGAALHVVLTGAPPYDGRSVEEVLHQAVVAAEPSFPDDAPEELVGICRRALRRDPAERFQDADELRAALSQFLRHSSARDLIVEAATRLGRLAQLTNPPVDDAAAAEIKGVFSECRFGFKQALRMWPSSKSAVAGLARCLELMARFEVSHDRADSAALLLAELQEHQSAPPDLVADVERLREERAEEAESLRRYREVVVERDARLGQKWRGRIMLAIALIWSSMVAGGAVLQRQGVVTLDAELMTWAHAGQLTYTTLAFYLFRRFVAKTRAARQVLVHTYVCLLLLPLVWWVVWRSGAPVWAGLATAHVVMALAGAAAATIDRRVWPTAVLLLAAAPLIVIFSDVALEINAVAVAVALGVAAWQFRGDEPGLDQIDEEVTGRRSATP